MVFDWETVQSAGAVEYTDWREVRTRPPLNTNECPSYDIKQSDDEGPVLELWGMWSTPSLLLLPGPL